MGDVVLIARTAKGLQPLLDLSVIFMDGPDLSTNCSKSLVMVIGPRYNSYKKFVVKGHPVSRVETFSSLGILLNSYFPWQPLLKKNTMHLKGWRTVLVLFRNA